jgi:hypothetical protein
MIKSVLNKIVIIALVPFIFGACDSIFDEGHSKRVFDGEELAFFPLSQEVTDADGSTSVEIQLIGEQRDSDLSVSYSVDGDSEAVEGEHFEFATGSPVTLSAGSNTVDININLLEDSVDDASARKRRVSLGVGREQVLCLPDLDLPLRSTPSSSPTPRTTAPSTQPWSTT